jgi:hypothetical protein
MWFNIFHQHYWGTPHPQKDEYYMICDECGKQRKLKINFNDNSVIKLSSHNTYQEVETNPEKIKRAA